MLDAERYFEKFGLAIQYDDDPLCDALGRIACQIETDLRYAQAVADERYPAWEWVESHGGLDQVRLEYSEGVRFGMIVDDAAERLGISTEGLDSQDSRERLMTALDRRLMPDGMEWPRFENGEPVEFGCEFNNNKGNTSTLRTVVIKDCRDALGGAVFWKLGKGACAVTLENGESVKRPSIKAADGKPIRGGEALYLVDSGREITVSTVEPGAITDTNGDEWAPGDLTHEKPVIAADGEPLEVGQTVWTLDNPSFECGVTGFGNGMVYLKSGADHLLQREPSQLTHQRPVLDADGVPIKKGDTVWHIETGREYVVVEPSYGEAVVVRLAKYDDAEGEQYAPDKLSHAKPEPPDSWEKWREEWQWTPAKYCKLILGVEYDNDAQLQEAFDSQGDDLMRRARALAGAER